MTSHARSAVFSSILAVAPVVHAQLLSVSTDLPVYNPGQTMKVSITATNPDPFPLVLEFDNYPQAWYQIDNAFGVDPGVMLPATSTVTIPPNSSHTWTRYHNWFDYNVPLGSHQIFGRLPWLTSPPQSFSVAPPTLPTSNFLIDFNGNGTDPLPSISDYWRLGVHFRSNTANPNPLAHLPSHNVQSPTNGYLAIGSTTYPPGFNIIADLDVPAIAATVDVSSAHDVAVTLIAKDALGNVLDTATSAPIPDPLNFLPISVHAPAGTSIASLEWWPSQQNAGIQIDNLAIDLPDPAALQVPGDIDGDGDMDLDDLGIWASNYTGSLSPGTGTATFREGDLDGDKDVDLDDQGIWSAHFTGSLAPSAIASVPEPASLLAAYGLALLHLPRRRRAPSRDSER